MLIAFAEAVYAFFAFREWYSVVAGTIGPLSMAAFGSDVMVGEGGILYASASLYSWYFFFTGCAAVATVIWIGRTVWGRRASQVKWIVVVAGFQVGLGWLVTRIGATW
jgi:hypothetical protein